MAQFAGTRRLVIAQPGSVLRAIIGTLNKNELLKTANVARVERLLASALSGDAKSRLGNMFSLSASVLADEPEEWPAQLIARLQNDKDPGVKRALQAVADIREGCWLMPIRAPLIPAGGTIVRIIDVGAPYGHSRALVWSKDRKTITSFSGSSFRTWDINTEREIGRLELPIEWGSAAIANPPRRAVVVAAQRQLLLVDLKSATVEAIFTGGVIEAVAISADAAWAVTTSVPSDWDYSKHEWKGPRMLRLFDLRRRSCIRTWQAHHAVITDLALSADGRFLATASDDQTAQLFDLRKENKVGSWRSARRLKAVALTPSGRRIAYISEGGTLTVREQDGHIVGRLTHVAAEAGCLSLSSNGRKAVMASNEGRVSVFDLPRSKVCGPFVGTQPYLTSLAIDGSARHAITGEMGRQLVVWDLSRGRKSGDTGPWISGIWASEEQALVQQDGLSLWDLATGKRTAFLAPGNYQVASAPGAGVWAVATWSARGGGVIRIGKWGRRQTRVLSQARELFVSIQISRNGERLVALVHPQGCRVLNLADGRTLWRRAELALGVRPYLSPSGRYLLLFSLPGFLEIVDLETQAAIQHSLPQPITGTVIFAREDDCILIQQGTDTVVLNWRTNGLRRLFHGSPSSMSEDGRWMVTESNGRKMTLWMLPEERRMATFTLDAPILHTALSPNGRFLTVGDQNGNVHILRRQS